MMAGTTLDIKSYAHTLSNLEASRFPDQLCFFRHKTQGEGISSCWRKNTSARESVELANVLRAFQKVAGHIGDNIGRIEYAGMSCRGGAIRIDPGTIMGAYPVPAEVFDMALGEVVYEALHQTQWSDHVWRLLESAMAKMDPMAHLMFQRIVHTGEDIYIHGKADESVFGLYTRAARKRKLAVMDGEMPAKCISLDELLFFWWTESVHFLSCRKKKSEYDLPLSALKRLAEGLMDILHMPLGVEKRCRERAELFLNAWPVIHDHIKLFSLIKKQLHWFRTVSSPGEKKRPEKNASTQVLTPTLAMDISANLAMDSVDITPLIRSVVGGDGENVVPMSRWDFHIPSHPVIDKKMVGRLKAIFQHYAARKIIENRGLMCGKIDPKRLYRSPINGRCFKALEKMPSLDWSVTLLIDASGSMIGSKWKMVENTVATIHKALSGYGNRLSAYAYFEVNGICMISKLLKHNILLSVPPSGQTASGQAIIFAALTAKPYKNKLIIHVTDGESNFGCDISYGIELCKKNKIDLFTLGCGTKERSIMEQQYKRAIQFVDNFEQLPHAMERLFRWTFLYGEKRLKIK